MNIIELTQGSDAWHKHRAAHFNASDAAAMLGISKHKTRTRLMHEMATGIAPDVDAATQRRFDDGHRFEALARSHVEAIIGAELYPVIGAEGKLSASFDGLTMDGAVCWEHKTANADLLIALPRKEIPDEYKPQMEQQLMLSGAQRCLLSATKWNGDVLTDEAHCWYEPDYDLRDRIIQGWTQFSIDLEEYKRNLAAGEIVAHKEMPKAEVSIDLPALFVHAKGEITTHNMDEFGYALTVKLSEVRAIALVTDQDFSNAKEAAKKFRDTAKAIALSKEQMLAQTETIGEAARKMDAWAKDLNATALQLEKDVEREDKAKKEVMVLGGRNAYTEHIAALEEEIKLIRLNISVPNFAEAIKCKRNYASMQDAVDTMLAEAKATADAQAKNIREKLAWCKDNAAGMSFLLPDLQQIITKPMDDFTLTITSRIKDHKDAEARKEAEMRAQVEKEAAAKLEAERARIQSEEEAKARAKVEASAHTTQYLVEGKPVAAIDTSAKPVEKSAEIKHIKPSRPSDKELTEFVAQNFNVSYGTACDWIMETAERMKQAA